jgi:hypothetical protein
MEAIIEKESMERMNDLQLGLVLKACCEGGNTKKAKIAEEILKERQKRKDSITNNRLQ